MKIDDHVKVPKATQFHLSEFLLRNEDYCYRYNKLKRRPEWSKNPPDFNSNGSPRWVWQVADKDFRLSMTRLVSRKFDSRIDRSLLEDAIECASRENIVHPIEDYLNSLQWDGNERIDGLLNDYFGCEDFNDDIRWLSNYMMLAPIHINIMQAGSQLNYMPILEGVQGIGKTRGLKILYFNENSWLRSMDLETESPKERASMTQGIWVLFFDEFNPIGKEWSKLKKFITEDHDSARMNHVDHTTDFERTCMLIAALNPSQVGDGQYIHDQSGGRRFLPVDLKGGVQTERLLQDRDQLWAEAIAKYRRAVTDGMLDDVLHRHFDKLEFLKRSVENRMYIPPIKEIVRMEVDAMIIEGKTEATARDVFDRINRAYGVRFDRSFVVSVGRAFVACGWLIKNKYPDRKSSAVKTYYLPQPEANKDVKGDMELPPDKLNYVPRVKRFIADLGLHDDYIDSVLLAAHNEMSPEKWVKRVKLLLTEGNPEDFDKYMDSTTKDEDLNLPW